MNNVVYQTKLLNKEIRHSNEYNQYIRTREKLKENEELYAKAAEFRKRSFQIQCEADYNTIHDMDGLYYEFEQILNNPMVNDFLVAEQRVMKMLQRMEDTIFEDLDLDFSIMEE